mmetsp:Transcript_43046/g.136827  ORF Transcript_43046/g.136827 Transcript_43046/m.136827 type:complete len:246 (+) Transcript_43046:393-1130(+)
MCRPVVVHEDRQDPDARRGVAVADGAVLHCLLRAVAHGHEALAEGHEVLGGRVFGGLRLRDEQLCAGLVLCQAVPRGRVAPAERDEGLRGEDIAQSELLLQRRVVHAAGPRELPAVLVDLEVVRAQFAVREPFQPGQDRHVDALPEGALQGAPELAVPVQELDGHDRVDDGVGLLLDVRHLLLPWHPRRRWRGRVHHLHVADEMEHGRATPLPAGPLGPRGPAAQQPAGRGEAALPRLHCRRWPD